MNEPTIWFLKLVEICLLPHGRLWWQQDYAWKYGWRKLRALKPVSSLLHTFSLFLSFLPSLLSSHSLTSPPTTTILVFHSLTSQLIPTSLFPLRSLLWQRSSSFIKTSSFIASSPFILWPLLSLQSHSFHYDHTRTSPLSFQLLHVLFALSPCFTTSSLTSRPPPTH